MTTALAGRTRNPGPIPGNVRIGGFGGAAGLGAYLVEHRIDRLIDATHPFAAEISRSARLAAERAGVKRLLLLRPRWKRHPLDRWIEVDSIEAAALAGRADRPVRAADRRRRDGGRLRAGRGRALYRAADRSAARRNCRCGTIDIVCGRGPFSLQEERHLLRQYGIDVLVCKASGGAATEAKLIAAREAGIPVIMVRRPPREPGEAVDTIEAALDWLAGLDRRQEEGRMP